MDTENRIGKADMEVLRKQIMDVTNASTYDHRPLMTPEVCERFPHMLEDCQLQYARFKLAITEVLKPRTIFEVGVGWGVSALAFKAGFPDCGYFGIDNGEMGYDSTIDGIGCSNGFRVFLPVHIVESDSLETFIHPSGQIDLIHIDGGHGRAQKARDMVKAFNASPEWILVDDFHDVMVMAGTADGIWQASANGLEMLYFENSHTGSLLIHAGRRAPEYRQ